MAILHTITIRRADTSEITSTDVEFSDQEEEILIEYLECAKRLATSKFIKQGVSFGLNIHWNHETGLAITTNLPDWDDMTVLMHRFRPFGLQNERTYFVKVANVISRRVNNPSMRNTIKALKDKFSGKFMQSAVMIETNDIVLNSEDTLNNWLNAYEYHRDTDKQQLVDDLGKVLTSDGMKAIFCHLMVDRVNAVFRLAGIIGVLLGEVENFEIKG